MKVVSIKVGEDQKTLMIDIQPDVGALISEEILGRLRIQSDLKGQMMDAVAELAWWDSLLKEIIRAKYDLKEIEYKQCMAHWRRYAHYVHMGRMGKKDKETIEAQKDLVSIIFSELTSVETRRDYADWAFSGYMIELGHRAELEKQQDGIKKHEEFTKRMYMMDVVPETYESLVRKMLDYDRWVSGLETIVDGFKQKGIYLSVLMSTEKAMIAEGLRFKMSEDFIEQVVEKIKNKGI